MVKVFNLPVLAEGIHTAVVIDILVKPGERVAAGQVVAVLENDKATADLPVPFAGVVLEIHKKAGDEISVGEALLSLEVSGEGESPPEPSTVSEPILPAGPAVRRLARELGVDLHEVAGTGPRARITPEDVRAHSLQTMPMAHQPDREAQNEDAPLPSGLPDFTQWGEIEVQPMSSVRRKTAEVVSLAWREIPHVVQHDRADVTELTASLQSLDRLLQRDGVKVTITAMVIKTVAAALKVFPRFNCSVDMAHHQLVYKKYIHLAVAVDAGYGLLAPVIRDAEKRSVLSIAEALSALSAKARDRQLTQDEMSGGTFAVSNLGGLGTTAFAPIVTWPHVGVLGVGKAEIQPIWRADAFQPRRMLPLSLSYDHRVNDGADAARFLRWIAEALENPLKILMEAG